MKRLIFGTALLSALYTGAYAQDEFVVGIPSPPDQTTTVFIDSLTKSPHLSEIGISIKTASIQNYSIPDNYKDALISGEFDFAFYSTEIISAFSELELPYAKFLDLPLIASDTAEMASIQNSQYGDVVVAEIGQTGVLPLAFWYRPTTQLISTSQIDSAKQFAGMKVIAKDALASDLIEEFGASASTLPQSESILALQRGAFEAAEWSPYGSTDSKYWGSVAKSAIVDFRMPSGFFVVHQDLWVSLTEQQRVAFRAAISEAELAAQESRDELSLETVADLRTNGIKVLEFSDPHFSNRNDIWNAVVQTWLKQGLKDGPAALELYYSTIRSIPENIEKRGDIIPNIDESSPIYFASDRKRENARDLERGYGLRTGGVPPFSCGKVSYVEKPTRSLGRVYADLIELDGSLLEDYASCVNAISRSANTFDGEVNIYIFMDIGILCPQQ
ncbi:TRAP transporter substrate-binding protein DctP [Microbaculum marinum]|uniref:TRAP transporter substrate-binding protein DctP n=1 Tax=Microbaculum marinum TaxID=1764581 RepID=A0AAW9RT19_9HYPH